MKKKLQILFVICLLLAGGCGNKKQVLDKPDDLIGRRTMVNIIAEAYIIESTIHLSDSTLSKYDLTQQYYRELFDRHKITRAQFIRSLNYYVSEESSAEKLLMEAADIIAKKHKNHNEQYGENEDTIPNIAPNPNNETITQQDIKALDTGRIKQ